MVLPLWSVGVSITLACPGGWASEGTRRFWAQPPQPLLKSWAVSGIWDPETWTNLLQAWGLPGGNCAHTAPSLLLFCSQAWKNTYYWDRASDLQADVCTCPRTRCDCSSLVSLRTQASCLTALAVVWGFGFFSSPRGKTEGEGKSGSAVNVIVGGRSAMVLVPVFWTWPRNRRRVSVERFAMLCWLFGVAICW